MFFVLHCTFERLLMLCNMLYAPRNSEFKYKEYGDNFSHLIFNLHSKFKVILITTSSEKF